MKRPSKIAWRETLTVNNTSMKATEIAFAAVMSGTMNGVVALGNDRNFLTGVQNKHELLSITPLQPVPISKNTMSPAASSSLDNNTYRKIVTTDPNDIVKQTIQSPKFPAGQGNMSVYVGKKDDIVKYVGITNNPERRFYQHLHSTKIGRAHV